MRKGRAKVEEKAHLQEEGPGSLAVRAGVLMDNMSMGLLTEALRLDREAVHELVLTLRETRNASSTTQQVVEANTRAHTQVWEQMVEIKHLLRDVVERIDNAARREGRQERQQHHD